MTRILSLILAIIMIIICSGCYWGGDHERRGNDDLERGGFGDRHNDWGDSDDRH